MTKFNKWFEKEELQIRDVEVEGYERIIEVRSEKVGLHGFVAVHSTKLGPALGGVRVYEYASEEQALHDVLRLSRGMTYKAALSNTGTGGGKGVIILKKGQKKSPELLQAFAKAIDYLQGEYIGAEDVNMSVEDVAELRKQTRYLVGLKHPSSSGNPALFTARGGYRGIQAALKKLYGTLDVKGRTIAVQGLGATGMELCRTLFWDGAELIVSDICQEKVVAAEKQFGAKAVSPKEILYAACDVLAPCAMGGVFSQDNIEKLQCRAIAGLANNQLVEESVGFALAEKDILYIPDFVINAGGLLNVSVEITPEGYCPKRARAKVDALYSVIINLIECSEIEGVPPFKVAERIVDQILSDSNKAERPIPTFHH
jgi:leucine dehydrogenase